MEASEIKEKLEKFASAVKEMQNRNDLLEKKVNEADNKQALEKAKEDVDKLSKSLETYFVEQAAQKKTIETLEKSNEQLVKSILESKNSDGDSYDHEREQAIARYMKKGRPIPEEIQKKMSIELVSKSTFGLDEKEIEHLATKDLLAGSEPDGGFFVSADRSARLVERVFETSPMRGLATVETTTSDRWEIILDDDEATDGGWVGEVDDRTGTASAKVGLLIVPIGEIYAEPKASQKMLDDAGFDIAGWHQRKVSRKFARSENTAFVDGDGSNKPKGFLQFPNWTTPGVYERYKVEQIETAGSGTIAGDDLIKLQGSLVEEFQASAVWAMKRETFYNYCLTLKSDDGFYLFNPILLATGQPLQILGKPVTFFADMEAVSGGNLAVAYADWSEFYVIVDRIGIRVIRDNVTAKPYTKFYTTKRVGGSVQNFQAGKLLAIKS